MARTRIAALLLVCVLAASCAHTADAFWGRARRATEEKTEKHVPAGHAHDGHDNHVNLDEIDVSVFHDPSEPPPFPEIIPEDVHSKTYYWYNEWTHEISWHEPSYEHHDEHGRMFYSNPDTRVSTWDKPDSLEWEEHLDDDSVPFYYNRMTKESTRHKPVMLSWVRKENEGAAEL